MQRLSPLLCLVIVGICPQSRAEDCANMKDSAVFARAMVSGPPGAWARVEIKCGDEVVATCTATVPVGGNKNNCRTEFKPLTRGEYACEGTASDFPVPLLKSANCY
jgi:hypothetical protein